MRSKLVCVLVQVMTWVIKRRHKHKPIQSLRNVMGHESLEVLTCPLHRVFTAGYTGQMDLFSSHQTGEGDTELEHLVDRFL